MRTTAFALFVLFTAPMFMNASCKKTVSNSNNTPEKCNPNVMCTMIFAMVTAQVQDKNGETIKLDDYYTIRTATGEKIKPGENGMDGSYTILDDSYQKNLQQSSDKFQFVGMKNGKQVINETYIISADCCHIQKKDGKAVIVVQ
ncbi:MAG: hypothetical protein EOP51_10930 [Sphingobacteriales bacterium]|nr:MAG: hypothetical protein EOP51_10930 [Sphingobacteriales bacterium]